MEGQIVFKGKSQKGKQIEIRYPNSEDEESMRQYINELSKERTFIRFQDEEVSKQEEEEYLNSQLDRITKKLTVQLLVFCEGKLVGISGIDMKDKIEKHLGLFGITINKDFRGEGIGSMLMKLVIEEAAKNLHTLEIIILAVYGENDLAKEMYKNFGFLEYGRLPKGIKRDDGYSDHIFMYKLVKG